MVLFFDYFRLMYRYNAVHLARCGRVFPPCRAHFRSRRQCRILSARRKVAPSFIRRTYFWRRMAQRKAWLLQPSFACAAWFSISRWWQNRHEWLWLCRWRWIFRIWFDRRNRAYRFSVPDWRQGGCHTEGDKTRRKLALFFFCTENQ